MGVCRARAPRHDIDARGHDEPGIEADAELADQVEIALRRLDLLGEGLRAGPGNRAEILDEFGLAHADAIIGDRERLLRLVGRDGDLELRRPLEKLGGRDRLVAQLVERIGGVGDELPQEHIAVGIDRVHHEMQELGHLGLEQMGLGSAGGGGVCGCRFAGHVTLNPVN